MSSIWQWLLPSFIAINLVLCSPIHDHARYELKDSHAVPDSWSSEGPAPSHYTINLQIGLKPGRSEELARHLYEGTPNDKATCHGD